MYSMCIQYVFNVYSMCIQCVYNVYLRSYHALEANASQISTRQWIIRVVLCQLNLKKGLKYVLVGEWVVVLMVTLVLALVQNQGLGFRFGLGPS